MPTAPAPARFFSLLGDALAGGTLVKLTLGKPRGAEPGLHNVFVRPITLKSGPHLTFVWRYATRDVTKNFPPAEALAHLTALLERDFFDAHLFTATQTAQLETKPDGTARLHVKATATPAARVVAAHDSARQHLIPANAPWLRELGVTNDRGQPREGMADKFRQIQKFAELLQHHVAETFPTGGPDAPLRITDMGSGKGYLTFAVANLFGERAQVTGIEARPELVELCNRAAAAHALASHLTFIPGTIADTPLPACEVLIALHACDTATDDALAQGIAAGARLLVVSPCCQKEIRAQLRSPEILSDALRHGIFQERQAEFVTDALRAQLLEWAGYKTKVFEFISTEHTAKNLLIVAQRTGPAGTPDDPRARRLRDFASFYGVRHQRLAEHLALPLT